VFRRHHSPNERGQSRPKGGVGSRHTEHVVVALLSGLAVACILVGLVTKPHDQGWGGWVSGLAVGLGGAFVASVLTFLLIDLMLARQRETETHAASERERLATSLARLRAGTLEENRTIVEELRSAGWLRNGALREANLSGANLEGVDLGSADLQGALFVGASLRKASFRYSDVSGAKFTHADLRAARFDGATTTGADFNMIRRDDDTYVP
jgi:Pentapeptide repeats (8 copies)